MCYALTCSIAGYASGSYYRQYFPTPRAEVNSQWQKTMLLTVLFFPTVVVSIVFCLNLIAEYYDTTNALHLSTIFKMFAIWLFVSFPLTVVGTMFGRHWGGKSDFPCRVNSMARPIPKGPWCVTMPCSPKQAQSSPTILKLIMTHPRPLPGSSLSAHPTALHG